MTLSVLKEVRIHQHAKFQAITWISSTGNARKPQIWPISLSQKSAKKRKINRPWAQSNQFWRWTRYISMPKCRPFPHPFSGKCPETSLGRTDMPQNGHGWSGGPADPCTGGNMLFQASDGRKDERTTRKHILPGPRGWGIIKTSVCQSDHMRNSQCHYVHSKINCTFRKVRRVQYDNKYQTHHRVTITYIVYVHIKPNI